MNIPGSEWTLEIFLTHVSWMGFFNNKRVSNILVICNLTRNIFFEKLN